MTDLRSLPLVYTGDYLNPSRESAPAPMGNFARRRQAARAVILDDSGAIHLMHVSKRGYYKLPGGGMEPGESVEDALAREVLEETGYTARIVRPIGRTVQYDHAEGGFIQDSYAFLVAIQSKALPQLTPGEADAGFTVATFPDLDSARDAVLGSTLPAEPLHSNASMIYRDAAILLAAIGQQSG